MASTLFNEFPRGPKIRPTKLYCWDMSKKKLLYWNENRYKLKWKNTVLTYIWIFVNRDIKPNNSLHYWSCRNSLCPMPTHWWCLKWSHSLEISFVLHEEFWYCLELTFYNHRLRSKPKLSCQQFSSQFKYKFSLHLVYCPFVSILVFQRIC